MTGLLSKLWFGGRTKTVSELLFACCTFSSSFFSLGAVDKKRKIWTGASVNIEYGQWQGGNTDGFLVLFRTDYLNEIKVDMVTRWSAVASN